MAQGRMQDRWAVGHEYELYLGKGGRDAARRFLAWLEPPAGSVWLESGVATGVLTQAVLKSCAPHHVTAVEKEPGYPGTPREHFTNPMLRVRLAEPEQLPVANDTFQVAVSPLALNAVADPALALAELRRAVRPDGIVSGYLWDYPGRMDLIRTFWDAAVALDPGAQELADASRAGLGEEALAELWCQAELTAVETHTILIPTVFPNFDTYWRPFLGGNNPAPTYCVGLSRQAREALRQRVSDALPIQEDGSINLLSRLLLVRGTVP